MVRHAAVAVPWARIVLVATLVVVLMEVVARRPADTWLLEAASVGLLAAAAAWCFDEPAATVVDPAPRTLAWRTGARCLGLVPLLAAWTWSVIRGWDGFFDRPAQIAVHGFVAVLAATAWTVHRRALGAAEPGARLAPVVVVVALCWPVSGRLADRVPIFPLPAHPDATWDTSRLWWCVLAAVAVGALALALTDIPRRMIRRSR
jgi:hypothetical protein